MRFAVRRPGSPVASPRSHGAPRRDVPSRIKVSVASVSAGRAPEVGLALARLRVYLPARRAPLARVRGTYSFDSAGRFLFQSPYQGSPTGTQDSPIEGGFRSDVPSRCIDRSRALRVIFFILRFSTRIMSNLRAVLVLIFSTQSSRRSVSRDSKPPDRSSDVGSAVRTALCPAELALKQNKPLLLSSGQPRSAEQFPAGKRGRHSYAAVDPNGQSAAWGRDWLGDGCERYMPPARSVTGDPIRLHSCRDLPGPAESHPACLRDPDLANVTGDPAYIPLPAPPTHDAESLVPGGLPPHRPTVRAGEEASHCPREIPQCLLLHHLAALPQPQVLRTGGGELPTLLQVAGRALPALSPVLGLLDRQVPHVPGMLAMSEQDSFLFRRRCQPVPRHTNIIANVRRRKRCSSQPQG